MLKVQSRFGGDWEYRTANTKEYTHGIHPYPAMMIPQVARRLIEEYGREGGVLLDPYCGTGTTLLEGMLANLDTIGTDLNPLARLIARTKTAPVDLDLLDREIRDFSEFGLITVGARDGQTVRPDIPNIDYWFSENVQRELGLIRGHIDWIESARIADFFRVAFSLTVRKVSWTKNSEFKLVRMTPERIEDHNPDVFSTMVDVLNVNRRAFASLQHALVDCPQIPSVHGFDTVVEIPKELIPPQSVDVVVTSPPYGDSKTTVAYGQFSRLSSQWLGYENANQVDNSLMGGSKHSGDVRFGFDELDDVITEIADVQTLGEPARLHHSSSTILIRSATSPTSYGKVDTFATWSVIEQ